MNPLKTAVDKLFSARFFMAVVVTTAGCFLTWKVCEVFNVSNKELVALVVGQFFMIWRDIIQAYFGRTDRKPVNGAEPVVKSGQQDARTTTGTGP